jgi:hypothetical protein
VNEGIPPHPSLDREAVARARRRQEAVDSLEFERQRESALLQRLEPIVRDAEAWRVDESALAQMPEEERDKLRQIGFCQPQPPEDARARFEAKIAELQAQIEDSRSRQRAFEAYTKALDDATEL